MEPIKSNLEPIEEKDLDLENKLKGVAEVHKEEQPYKVEVEHAHETVAAEKDASYQDVLSKIKTANDDQRNHVEIEIDAKQVKELDCQSHVQQLVNIALAKGVLHAVKVAKHLDDNYALDTFHDQLLTDQLQEALRKKGLIEEV